MEKPSSGSASTAARSSGSFACRSKAEKESGWPLPRTGGTQPGRRWTEARKRGSRNGAEGGGGGARGLWDSISRAGCFG